MRSVNVGFEALIEWCSATIALQTLRLVRLPMGCRIHNIPSCSLSTLAIAISCSSLQSADAIIISPLPATASILHPP